MEVDGGTPDGDAHEARLEAAPADGVLPEGFYATTNFPTEVRIDGAWHVVANIEMDVVVRVARAGAVQAEACPMHRIRKGDLVVVGEEGVRVAMTRSADADSTFRFMSSAHSTERPKARLVADVATAMKAARTRGERILFVGGPAIVHSGSAPALASLVREGWVDVLFAGNALALHDIEAAMFGTSLGVDVATGESVPHGHQHHLRAVNRVRRAGSIANAVSQGLVRSGVMHACIERGIPFVLAGSIRDDGPLPDVITDVVVAADRMRELVRGVGVAIVVATTLHGVATGNLLAADVATFCVDTSVETVTKLVDRGTHQAVGIVTDCEYFLSELRRAL